MGTCVNERLPLKNTLEESIPRYHDDLATKKKMKQKKTGYGIISLSVVAALFFVVALKSSVFPGGGGGVVPAFAVAGGCDTTSSLLRTSNVSTSTSKVMAQEDEDSFNIVSNMDGSSKSTQKPIKKMGEVEYFE